MFFPILVMFKFGDPDWYVPPPTTRYAVISLPVSAANMLQVREECRPCELLLPVSP